MRLLLADGRYAAVIALAMAHVLPNMESTMKTNNASRQHRSRVTRTYRRWDSGAVAQLQTAYTIYTIPCAGPMTKTRHYAS